MDDETLNAYARHAADFIARDASVESPLARYFDVAFAGLGAPPRILDVGAGTGREVAALLRARFDAWGVEPVDALRMASGTIFPGVADRMKPGLLPGLPSSALGQHDGVLCSAVLQHIPRNRLFDAVLDLRDVLRPGGRALVSIPAPGRSGLDGAQRDPLKRLFTEVTADELQLLFERVGFTSLARWEDGDALGRPGVRWITLLFERGATSGTRGIDRIASIMGAGERKVATYKLALLRALAEIAMTQAHRVRWRADGQVEVPARAIAERWLRYYWPLCDPNGSAFFPQMSGEAAKRRHSLAFTAALEELRAHFPGGLGQLEQSLRGGLGGEVLRRYEAALQRITHAILAGPVTYAGGVKGRVFSQEKRKGADGVVVLVPAPIWRELSLLSHWIEPAILLRWAELTSRLSGGAVGEAAVLERLLYRPEAERDAQARDIYLRHQERGTALRSVWSDRPLQSPRELEVDHVIPWSLWHNNDLWNLVPAHRSENQQKRDDLPSRALVRGRRDSFAEAWTLTLEAAPARFLREASGQLGRQLTERSAFFDELFDVMVESLETTRIQRGLAEWAPVT